MHYMFNSPAAKKTLRTKSNKIRKNSKPLHSKSMAFASPSSTTTINHYHFHFIDKRVTNKDSAIAYGGIASIVNPTSIGQSNYIQGGGGKNPRQALPRTPSFSSGQPQWINQSSDNSSPFSHSATKGSNLSKKVFTQHQNQRSSLARSSESLPNLRSNEEAKLNRGMPFDARKDAMLNKKPPPRSTSELMLPPVFNETTLFKNKFETQLKPAKQRLEGNRSSIKNRVDNLLKKLLENDGKLARLIMKREGLLRGLLRERKTLSYLARMSDYNVERAQLEAHSLELQKELEHLHFTSSERYHTQPFFTN